MSVDIIVTGLISVIGSGGLTALITAWVTNRKNSKDSEATARAQKTDDFGAVVAGLNELLDEYKESLTTTKIELNESRQKHEDAEQYILIVRDGIYEGTIPPFPPRNQAA